MDLKKLVGTDKLVFGTERTLKELKKGTLERVIIASNCAQETKESIEAAKGKAAVVVAREDNDELGTMCKKPFRVAVLGVRNG